MKINNDVESIGKVQRIITYKDGSEQIDEWIKNSVLDKGRAALAATMANLVGETNEFYISRMIFGDGGTTAGVKKTVNASRTGLFGITRLSKPVTAIIDDLNPKQASFTSVITFEDIVGVTINEMALQMSNGDLYSMVTFPDFTKTSEMQITWNWVLNWV